MDHVADSRHGNEWGKAFHVVRDTSSRVLSVVVLAGVVVAFGFVVAALANASAQYYSIGDKILIGAWVAMLFAIPVAGFGRRMRVRLELHDEGVLLCNYLFTGRYRWDEIATFKSAQTRRRTLPVLVPKSGRSRVIQAAWDLQDVNTITSEREAEIVVHHLNDVLEHHRSSDHRQDGDPQ